MKTLTVKTTSEYSIYLDPGILQSNLLRDFCLQMNKRVVIITDSHLEKLWGETLLGILRQQGVAAELFSFPAGESYKTRETKQALEDRLLEKKYGRDTCLIALGGGVVTDLVGFLAATYCRGIPVIYVPTSLLAMVDASIGGKTGVNTPYGKNQIGSFTQPQAVMIDTELLKTLPQKEWQNGMAEIIKHGVIAEPHLLEMLQNNISKIKAQDPVLLNEIIEINCIIKKQIVEQDEKESGLRELLNFGHTIGHAIEIIENYQIDHGQAVAIGMLVEGYLSLECGFFKKSSFDALDALMNAYEFPLETSAFNDIDAFEEALKQDKKTRHQMPRFVILEALGTPHTIQNYAISVDALRLQNTLMWAQQRFAAGKG